MGTDPRRLDGLLPDETVAALLVERATGALARAHDVDGRQGAYDVALTYPDGRRAALEVTTNARPGIRERGVLLHRSRSAPPAGPSWSPPGAAHIDNPSLTQTIADAVGLLLRVPHVARRVAKVAAAQGVEERHLFVGIGEGGLPDAVYRALSGPVDLRALANPDVEEPRLTHLWLTTDGRGSPLLCWERRQGWTVRATG